MEDRYKIFGYEITTDSQFQSKRFGVTPELSRQLEALGMQSQDPKNKKIIEKLTQLILQYPTVPVLKNYLSVAYNVQGNHPKSVEINRWLLAEHPDYLFGRLNQANVCIENGEFDKVPEILGEAMEIKQLYPERDVFHLTEVTAYLKVVIRYFVAIENQELAENRLKIMKEIAPDHHDTESAEFYLMALRLKSASERWEEESKQRITPKYDKFRKESSQTAQPIFNHPEINSLYQHGLNIPHEILREILALPRQTLIADLVTVLHDSVFRFDYFNKLDYEEETHNFVLHAMFLLKELNAVESLDVIFSVLALDRDYLELWFGDHLTSDFWQIFYQLGFHQPEVLKSFLIKPGIDTFSKSAVSDALCQMILHHPEKRDEISAIYSEVFTLFSEASIDDNLIDSEFLGLAISDAIDCRLYELLPIIKVLYEKGYVSLGICGSYTDVVKEFRLPPKPYHKRNIYTIFELYDDILSTWYGYNPDRYDKPHTDYLPPQPVKSEKIGRNDDCPCGSGKKYKKCCGK